jgi:type IV secretory pathway component VirB8
MEHQEQQGTMEKRQSTRALQQSIQPKRHIANIASWTAVNRDISYLRNEAKTNIKKHIDERLPEEYEKCLVGLNARTREAWNTAQNTED